MVQGHLEACHENEEYGGMSGMSEDVVLKKEGEGEVIAVTS